VNDAASLLDSSSRTLRFLGAGLLSSLLCQGIAYSQDSEAQQVPADSAVEPEPAQQPPPPEASTPSETPQVATPDAGVGSQKSPSAQIAEDTATELGAITVLGDAASAKERAKYAVEAVPGAARVKDSSRDLQRQATSLTVADLLSFTPGVYAQASGANQGIRLSIRGSGINNTQVYKGGVGFYFDGLLYPGIQGSGVPPFLFEPLTVNYTEILPGANAFELQPLMLGGAANFVDHTGYTASPFQARVDAGSFWYFKGQVSTGRVEGKADYYLSANISSIEGFQAHSKDRSARVIANFGYKLSPNINTRFYFRWSKERFEYPGMLTPDQIEENPRRANPTSLATNNYYETPGTYWFGNKTVFKIGDNSEVVFGVSYDKHIQYTNSRGVANSYYADYAEQNLAPSLVYRRSGTLLGRQSKLQIGVRNTTVISGRSTSIDYTTPTSPTYGLVIRDFKQSGTSFSAASLSHDWEVLPKLWLKTGIAGVYTRSSVKYTVAQTEIDNTYAVLKGFDWTGVLGLRYELTPSVQLFSNLSRAVQPPLGSRANATQNGAPNIKNQNATTVEVGTRAKVGIVEGSLSYYYSAVRKELLTVAVQLEPQIITAQSNATPTTHQGIEVGLDTSLWRGNGSREKPSELLLRQAYTWSKFNFNDDPLWGSNQLPGVPEHFYQAELLLQTGGFSVGVNTQVVSKVGGDFANSLFVPSYTLFGAKASFAPEKMWEFHVDVRNIGDTHYASYVQQVADARGAQQPIAAVGEGFGLYGGFSVRY